MDASKIIAGLKSGGPIFTLLGLFKDQITNKMDADAAYRDLVPVLKELLNQGYGYKDENVQRILGAFHTFIGTR